MVRQWKDTKGEGGSYVEELGSIVFVLWAALVTLSLFAVIIFFCADGVPKNSTKASADNNCTAGCGTACGGGCGA